MAAVGYREAKREAERIARILGPDAEVRAVRCPGARGHELVVHGLPGVPPDRWLRVEIGRAPWQSRGRWPDPPATRTVEAQRHPSPDAGPEPTPKDAA